MHPARSAPRDHAIAGALSLVLAALIAGCGGGGDATPPPNTTLGPGESSVVSSDGKVTVAVGANALQGAATVTIEPATPDAETAADPTYVPGTTYRFSALDIQVPEQVLITIESPLAVASSRVQAEKGEPRLQALPPGYFPPPTCLVNSPNILSGIAPVQTIFVAGPNCPASPAPACIKLYGDSTSSFCAPALDMFFVFDGLPAGCPTDYREVTGDPAFSEFALSHPVERVCLRQTTTTPPVLVGPRGSTRVNCSIANGKFLCLAPVLINGVYSVLLDKTIPAAPDFTVSTGNSGDTLYFDDLETPPIHFRIKASDPNGIGGVELIEYFNQPGPAVPGARRWQADPALFAGAAVKNYDSLDFTVPYTASDPSVRTFIARVYDKAGNSAIQWAGPVKSVVTHVQILSFTATPASLQFPGGPVTLAWSVKGSYSGTVDAGVGTVYTNPLGYVNQSGSTTVDVAQTTTFTLTAAHPTRQAKMQSVTVTVGADATPPTVSLQASATSIVAPGSATLTATANDLAGVTKVEFYRGANLIATDTSAPYTHTVSFTVADIGIASFTAKAYDAANNSATSAVVNVAVGADVTPPTVNLLANPATVLVPGSTTLMATASDNIGVTKVEFFRGATLVATVNAAPFQTVVNLTTADLGTVAFTAKAYDAQNNSTTSAVVNVLATTPSAGDTYASPTGVDVGNTTCSQASPCRSIALAAATAQANKTVWLMNGDYTGTTQPAPIAIPAGLTLRALTPGLAGVGQGIVMQGSGSLVGVVVRRYGFGDLGYVQATSGTLTVDGVKVIGSVTAPSGFPAPLALSGTVIATMTPGNIADYADQLTQVGQGTATYATLAGAARLTVNGGTFGGAALGGSDGIYGAFNRGAFNLTGSSRLDLYNVVLNVESSGIFLYGGATQVNLAGSTLHAAGNIGPGYGIHAAKGAPQVTIVNSTISGFDNAYTRRSFGIAVGAFAQPGVALMLSATNSSIASNNHGVFVDDAGSSPSSLAFTGTGVGVTSNTHGGIVCRDACNVDLSGGEVSGNATNDPAANSNGFQGGIWMGLVAKTYQLKLRNVMVIDNKSTAGSNANSSDNSGVTMKGSAASTFDLGTAASPGNNVIQGNTSSAQTSGLWVNVAAGVMVNAVGNTFAPNVQGANAQGKYQLGTAPCGASTCDFINGAGANYRVTTGTLRLAN